MTLRSSDLQSDGDLDSIHNSCDVSNVYLKIHGNCKMLSKQRCIDFFIHSIYEATLKPWLIFANLNPSVYCSAGISGHQKLQGIKRGTHGQVVMMIRQEIHIYANARAKAAI